MSTNNPAGPSSNSGLPEQQRDGAGEFDHEIKLLRDETERVGTSHDPKPITHREALVKASYVQIAHLVIRRRMPRLISIVSAMSDAEVAQANLAADRDLAPSKPVLGPDGESTTVTEAAHQHDDLVRRVRQQSAAGLRQHERVSRPIRLAAIGFVVVDAVVIFLFLAEVLNVNVQHLGRTPFTTVTAALLALIATVAYAISLGWAGQKLRSFKNGDRSLSLPRGGARILPIAMLIGMLALPVAVGGLMVYRIQHDAVEAVGGSNLGGDITGLFMGAMVCVLGWVIGLSAFLDGSRETECIDHYASFLDKHRKDGHRCAAKIDYLWHGILRDNDELEANISETLVEASDQSRDGDWALLITRAGLHSATPYATTISDPNHSDTVAGFLEQVIEADIRDIRDLQRRAASIMARAEGRSPARQGQKRI